MQPKTFKSKKSYFNSPKKELLVKKMILDPHEAMPPSSCFDLRPINQNQSNQQDMIFDSKSSSMKQISDFEKNSLHEFDKIIFGLSQHNNHNDNMFLHTERSNQSEYIEKENHAYENYSENSNSLKRDTSLTPQEVKRYQNVVKIFQTFDQHHQSQQKFNRISSQPNVSKHVISIDPKNNTEIVEDVVKLEDQQPQNAKNSLVWPNQQILKTPKAKKIFVQRQKLTPISNKPKPIRKFAEGEQFQLVNQFTELMSYSSLIEDMITVYDRSPLFEATLDFDSEPEETNQEEDFNISSKKDLTQKQNFNQHSDPQIKIQEISMDLPEIKFDSEVLQSQKNQKEQFFTMLDKMRIDDAPQKNKKIVIKEIKFQRTKTYLNFYEPIQEIKPYIKKMTLEEKKIFLAFKKQLKQIKDIMDYFDKRKKTQKKHEHICKICGQQFESGRQLGGHMSRKHPGKALEYIFKKELRKVKEIERNRRKYFKNPKKDIKNEQINI